MAGTSRDSWELREESGSLVVEGAEITESSLILRCFCIMRLRELCHCSFDMWIISAFIIIWFVARFRFPGY